MITAMYWLAQMHELLKDTKEDEESALEREATTYQRTQETETRPTYDYQKLDPLSFYPSKTEIVNGVPIHFVNAYTMGSKDILGLCNTYTGEVFVREGLRGENKDDVIDHELHHRQNPMDSELETRVKTGTLEPSIHPYVSSND